MFFVVKVNMFNGTTDNPARPDKNGLYPVLLTSYNGTIPSNTRVIAGTVAHRAGLEPGKNFAIQLTKTSVDPQYGDRYQIDVIGEVTTLEIVTKIREFGQGQVQVAPGVKSETRVLDTVTVEED